MAYEYRQSIAAHKAENIITKARIEAERIIAQAHIEAQNIRAGTPPNEPGDGTRRLIIAAREAFPPTKKRRTRTPATMSNHPAPTEHP